MTTARRSRLPHSLNQIDQYGEDIIVIRLPDDDD